MICMSVIDCPKSDMKATLNYSVIMLTKKTPNNSPVLQFGAPPAIDSGEAKMRTASWENVDK